MDIITQLIFRAKDEASGTVNQLKGAVEQLFKGFVAFQGAKTIKEFTGIAARGEVLATVLNVVGTNAGIATTSLDKMVAVVS